MHDIFTALVLILIAYVVVKIFSPSSVPDYKLCAGDSCWSTGSDPVEKTASSVSINNTEKSQPNTPPLQEVAAKPKDMQDPHAGLKDLLHSEDMLFNNGVKYNKY